tara:strand:- start:117 stop:284 length:168 start_codon:yes stop_codon:yes gene_type:complete
MICTPYPSKEPYLFDFCNTVLLTYGYAFVLVLLGFMGFTIYIGLRMTAILALKRD